MLGLIKFLHYCVIEMDAWVHPGWSSLSNVLPTLVSCFNIPACRFVVGTIVWKFTACLSGVGMDVCVCVCAHLFVFVP